MFYQQSDQVKVKKVGKENALYVPEQKGIHVLNDTAFFIWEALASPLTFDELHYMLGQVFQGDPAAMETDLRETLDLFSRYRLIHTRT